jgi:hypothetical protein
MLIARRLFLLAAVLAALAMLMAPLAGADDDDDGGGGGDAAFCAPAGDLEPGQCSIAGGVFRFDFLASGPLGESPTGTFRIEFGLSFYEFEIACLQVAENRASFGGTVTASNYVFAPVGSWAAHTVLDNAPLNPDLLSNGTSLPAPPPATAATCGDVEEVMYEVAGDIVVQDNTSGGGDDDDDEDDGDDDGDDDDDDDGDDDD